MVADEHESELVRALMALPRAAFSVPGWCVESGNPGDTKLQHYLDTLRFFRATHGIVLMWLPRGCA